MNRRGFLKGLGGVIMAAGACSLLPSAAQAAASEEHLAYNPLNPGLIGRGQMSTEMGRSGLRQLSLAYAHGDGEAFDGVYWRDGQYVHNALAAINDLMRDRRRNVNIDVDPALLDLVHDFALQAGIDGEIQIISGYREDSRAGSRRRRGGTDSMHAFGMAIDIKVPGRSNLDLVNIAWDMQRGGVGYYGNSRHVHLDVGDVRRWGFGRGTRASTGSRGRKPAQRKPNAKAGGNTRKA